MPVEANTIAYCYSLAPQLCNMDLMGKEEKMQSVTSWVTNKFKDRATIGKSTKGTGVKGGRIHLLLMLKACALRLLGHALFNACFSFWRHRAGE